MILLKKKGEHHQQVVVSIRNGITCLHSSSCRKAHGNGCPLCSPMGLGCSSDGQPCQLVAVQAYQQLEVSRQLEGLIRQGSEFVESMDQARAVLCSCQESAIWQTGRVHTPVLGGEEWELYLHKVCFGGVTQEKGEGPAEQTSRLCCIGG